MRYTRRARTAEAARGDRASGETAERGLGREYREDARARVKHGRGREGEEGTGDLQGGEISRARSCSAASPAARARPPRLPLPTAQVRPQASLSRPPTAGGPCRTRRALRAGWASGPRTARASRRRTTASGRRTGSGCSSSGRATGRVRAAGSDDARHEGARADAGEKDHSRGRRGSPGTCGRTSGCQSQTGGCSRTSPRRRPTGPLQGQTGEGVRGRHEREGNGREGTHGS